MDLPGDYRIIAIPGMPRGGIVKLEEIITVGISFLFLGASILALVFLLWGGIQWITSGGDKAGIDAARKKITFALIGLSITFLGFFIINFIGYFFGVKLIG